MDRVPKEILEIVSGIFKTGNFGDDYTEILGKISTLFHYGLEINPENFRDLHALDNASVTVKSWKGADTAWSYRNSPQRLDRSDLYGDVLVFTHELLGMPFGWIPTAQIEERPSIWVYDSWGEAVDYYHNLLTAEDLIGMPEQFVFVDPCQHFDRWGGIYDDSHEAFQCCGCGRFIHDSKDREWIRSQSPDHHRLPA